uniref:PABS domain-containing protein n=1 Tax=Chromera velia CCMP2878 TaxID=1169474 RepID=A0A0G4H4N5_9ALVE|mmetsp:Transcript_3414/g.7071  ORF Transcript_3414/g.7071 Transcript_3414/m.7071 type:complete len:321 (+) Transcript_3414:132-1094(+)|eukprot:Cvel_24648.t1-p1 / transcript=Cvel_24648.t1 / gene=Cvel_24648 / organism=Chromera_velia_CCMP2878 / gene_product=Spermidine synthase, putative / transcript_product=Spermidine synthase, putative / location=Cvel_scaffold2692:20914-23576(-) / protein_length=320 / sequence_SO=supercontig / SO=protein_coding / is_pseudo=false
MAGDLSTERILKWVGGAAAVSATAFALYKLAKRVGPLSSSWFAELGSMWPGQAMCLEVEKVLYKGRSKFQDVLVFQSKTWGKVLVLDGVIQVTERDEFAYQEMMAHLPLFTHPNPKKALVIGGGDGGILREIARHPSVEEIDICEIDGDVIEMAKKHLQFTAVGYSDPRVRVRVEDGFEFMKRHKNEYDVIVVDSSDPVGPAEVLFKEPFYAAMSAALRDGGVAATQGECMWLHLELLENLLGFSKKLFSTVQYAQISIPTYPCGTIGVLCLGKSKGTDFKNPKRTPSQTQTQALRYYTPAIHKAAFILPAFASKALGQA